MAKAGYIASVIKKLIVLAIIVGAGYGGWRYYQTHPEKFEFITKRTQDQTQAVGGNVGTAAADKAAKEAALKD